MNDDIVKNMGEIRVTGKSREDVGNKEVTEVIRNDMGGRVDSGHPGGGLWG